MSLQLMIAVTIVAGACRNRDTLLALVNYSREAGDFASALEYAERLARAAPDDPAAARLIDTLPRESKKSDGR